MPDHTRLDHVGVVAHDLARLVAAYRRLGFALTEPRELLRVDAATGTASRTGQWSCHAVFQRGYLELTALLVEDPAHHLTPLLAEGEGLRIVVHASESLAADRERLRAKGHDVGPLARASRPIDYGSRRGEARFEWFRVDPPGAGPARGLTAYVHHLTPELVFQPEVMTHPNGAVALLEVRPFESFTVGVADLEAAGRLLAAHGVRCRPASTGGLEVGPEEACGATLRLAQWPPTGPATARLS